MRLAKQGLPYIKGVTLSQALAWTPEETMRHLSRLVSPADIERLQRHENIPSPLQRQGIQDSKWLQNTNLIGINTRAIKSYFNILKTAMIYPEQGVHLLPHYTTPDCIYEPLNWKPNPEFIDPYLTKRGLKTPEAQLRFVINALHAMGKVIGADVLPHASNAAQELMVHPEHFYWMKLNQDRSGQLFPKSLQYERLSGWLQDKVNTYYLHSQTKEADYERYFKSLRQKSMPDPKSLVLNDEVFGQLFEPIAHVFAVPLARIADVQTQATQLLGNKSYAELSMQQKEALQRAFENINTPLLNPQKVSEYFRKELAVLPDYADNSRSAKIAIIDFLKRHGDSQGNPIPKPDQFYTLPAEKRAELLFGPQATQVNSPQARLADKRRFALINHLREQRLHPEPVADSRFLRPIHFDRMAPDKNPSPKHDKPNLDPLCKYEFFGTLTPYAFYPLKDSGYYDVKKPNKAVFDYFADKVKSLHQALGMDFIRADMGHVQLTQATDNLVENPLEFWAHTKKQVQRITPSFAIWGESFLDKNKPLDPVVDVNRKLMDTVLGNIHIQPVNAKFMSAVARKSEQDLGKTRETFSVITHDEHVHGSDSVEEAIQQGKQVIAEKTLSEKLRYFMNYFLNQPGYVMSGQETVPVSPHHDYLFPNKPPFNWGSDLNQFQAVQAMRARYAKHKNGYGEALPTVKWLTAEPSGLGAWVQMDKYTGAPKFLMVANSNLESGQQNIRLKNPFAKPGAQKPPTLPSSLKCKLSTESKPPLETLSATTVDNGKITIPGLKPGEGRIYRLRTLEEIKHKEEQRKNP